MSTHTFEIKKIGGDPLEVKTLQRGNKKPTTIPFDLMYRLTQTDTGAMIEKPNGDLEFILCTEDQYKDLDKARDAYLESKGATA